MSKTEEIKAPVAWASPRNHAMTRCFRCASVCFRCAFGVALHGAQADLLRFGHLAPSMRRADTRAGLSTMCPVQAVVLSCFAVRERGLGALDNRALVEDRLPSGLLMTVDG